MSRPRRTGPRGRTLKVAPTPKPGFHWLVVEAAPVDVLPLTRLERWTGAKVP